MATGELRGLAAEPFGQRVRGLVDHLLRRRLIAYMASISLPRRIPRIAGTRVRLGAVRTTVAGVLLAAGEGSRFGRPKALVELNGQTLAERGVQMLARRRGPDPGRHRRRPGRAHRNTYCLQPGTGGPAWAPRSAPPCAPWPRLTGQALTGTDAGAAVVALADQPLVGSQAVARLIAAYREGASVAVATYDGQPRNPVLLAREHWPEVAALATGDTGARAFLRARADLVTQVECGDTGHPDDIDTPADLARIAGSDPELIGSPAG